MKILALAIPVTRHIILKDYEYHWKGKEYIIVDDTEISEDGIYEKFGKIWYISERKPYKVGVELKISSEILISGNYQETSHNACDIAQKFVKQNRMVYATIGGMMRFDSTKAGQYLLNRGVDLIIIGTDEVLDGTELWISVFNAYMSSALDSDIGYDLKYLLIKKALDLPLR